MDARANAATPFENSWWVVPGSFLAGPYPGTPDRRVLRDRLTALIDLGIRTFVNLQQPLETSAAGRFPEYAEELDRLSDAIGVEVQLVRVPFADGTTPSVRTMAFALDVLDAALARGFGVFLHCQGGHGRTGTVVGCWLRRHGGFDGEAALERIAALRRGFVHPSKGSAPQTAGQFAFVRAWREPQREDGAADDFPPRGGRGPSTPLLQSQPTRTAGIAGASDSAPRSIAVPRVVRLREPEPLSAEDRYQGALVGLAVGDALGAQVEFEREGRFAKVTEMEGGGPFNLPPGAWTDDTSLALCLAESLVERKGFDAVDQLERYLRWYREGYLSSVGNAFDVGGATRAAIERFSRTREPNCSEPDAAGNGSLMRLAPVPLAFAAIPDRAVELAGESSRTTHDTPQAIDACRYWAGLILGALQGRTKAELVDAVFSPTPETWRFKPLCPEIANVLADGSSCRRLAPPPPFQTTMGSYVVESMEIALWAFWSTSTFEEGAIAAVNVGRDTDTYGAIYGQLAGAFYGYRSIPERWRSRLVERELIRGFAQQLLDVRGSM